MNKPVVLLILFLFTIDCSIIEAQSISQFYPEYEQGATNIEQVADGFILFSQTEDEELFALKVDEEGNKISTTIYFEGSAKLFFKDDYFYEAGSVGVEPNRDILVKKMDADGNLIFQKTIVKPGDNFGIQISNNQEGDILIAGVTSTAGDSLYQITLTKLDVNGNLIWNSIVPKELNRYDIGLDYIYSSSPGNGSLIDFKIPEVNGLSQITMEAFI